MNRFGRTALVMVGLGIATDAGAQEDTGAAHFRRPPPTNLVDEVKTVGPVYTVDNLKPLWTYELVGHDLPTDGNTYAKLTGAFPKTNGAVPLEVKKRSATSWTITMPDVDGALYQSWTQLRIYKDDKQVSETTIKFEPRLETKTYWPYLFPGEASWVKCSPNTNKDECKSFLAGSHMSVTHLAPQGTDIYYFKLKNGWRATRLSSFSCSGISAKCSTYLDRESVTVQWRMPTVANLHYSGNLEIIGPAGTDYK
jgi:hypothetical protein